MAAEYIEQPFIRLLFVCIIGEFQLSDIVKPIFNLASQIFSSSSRQKSVVLVQQILPVL